MPTLLFHYPDKEKRWKVEVEQDRFTIGRSREAEVCVPHSSVSKKHLLIERRGSRYFFRDLGSKNGIYLNEFRKPRGSLSDGDELRLGSIRVTFYHAAAPARALEALSAPPAPAAEPDDGAGEGPLEEAGETSAAATTETIVVPAAPVGPLPLEPDVDLDLDFDLEHLPEGEPGSIDGRGLAEIESAPVEAPARPAPPKRIVQIDAPQPERQPRRISISLPVLLAAAAACVGLGLFLGHVASLLDEAPPARDPPAAKEGASSAPPAPVPARAPETAREAGAASSIGPPADLGHPETRARLIVRLHLDLLDRPPTRDEMARIAISAHDRLWYDIAKKAGFRPDSGAEQVFALFMGRKPEAAELEPILAAAGGDMDHFAFLIGTSRDYAARDHRRKRSAFQLTRSLIVDLLDLAPPSDTSAEVLGEIEDAKGLVEPVAKVLAQKQESRAGPRPGETPETWLAGAYERLLLRSPSAEEKRRGLAAMASREDGWRDVLAGLAARDEYLEY